MRIEVIRVLCGSGGVGGGWGDWVKITGMMDSGILPCDVEIAGAFEKSWTDMTLPVVESSCIQPLTFQHLELIRESVFLV